MGGGIKDLFKIFASKRLKVSSIFNVPMPSNYTPYGITPEDRQKELFANIDSKTLDSPSKKVKNLVDPVKTG